MIIGNGLIANRFIEYAHNDKFLIFASSHSNSKLPNSEYDIEVNNVEKALKENPNLFFVFFSTTSIYDSEEAQSSYVISRLKTEDKIKKNAKNYLIIRVPQLVGQVDDDTLINFLINKISNNEKFDLWNSAARNILDIDDLFFITDKILREKLFSNQIINISNPENVKVSDLVGTLETFLGKKANYKLVSKGNNYTIEIDQIRPIILDLGLRFGDDYLERTISKYYNYRKGIVQKISIVVPTYFAEKGIDEFYSRTKKVLNLLNPRFTHEMIFVNDGSTDKTLEKLIKLSNKDEAVKVINLSRNFGNQHAITAGIDKTSGDAVVIIDDDLQDPPELILSMLAIWDKGYDIVYAVRRKRKSVNFFFDYSAKTYYRLIDYLSEVKIPVDTGDFRLIDKRVLSYLRLMKEENRYFRGMVAWVGFKQVGLYYDRDARYAGKSNFTLKKYFKFAFAGLSSFSEKPLYFSSMLGLIITSLSVLFSIWIVIQKILRPEYTVKGWTSLVAFILFFGGIQLLSTGVIGLYIGKIYREVKGRPIYIVESEHGFKSNNKAE